MGLPGSGKTTISKNLVEIHNENLVHIELDTIKNADTLRKKEGEGKNVIFDGLFLNTTDIITFLHKIRRIYGNLFILYFKPDKARCLKNDTLRGRNIKAEASIKYNDLEYPNMEMLDKETHMTITIIEQEIYNSDYNTPPEIQKMPPKTIKTSIGTIESESWCLGGTVGSCWDSELSSVSGESPVNFIEFDEYLEEISPNITFLQYRKLFDACVRIEEYGGGDYYGGGVDYAKYICNMENLHTKMKEMGIIQ